MPLNGIRAQNSKLAVLYPGSKRFPLGERVEAVPLEILARPGALFSKSSFGG